MELDGEVFKETLLKTVVASEVSDLRPEISGVLLVVEPSMLKVVATDSFRLAEATLSGESMKNTFDKGFKITIPLKTAQELARILGDKEKVRFFTDETQIVFESESLKLVSRVIDGKFPDYDAIIPKDIDTKVVVSREELISGIKLAGSFAGRNSEVVVSVKDGKVLEIYSGDSHIGENKYIIPAKASGPEMEIAFNWQYLLEGIRNEDSKDVILGLNGEESPTVIRSTEDSNYFYILMPIKA